MTGAMNVSGNDQSYNFYQTSSRKEDVQSFASTISAKAEGTKSQRGSVMEEYYAKKPEYKAVQQKRVEGGYTVLASAGLSAGDLENMSVSEFRTLEPLLQSIGATASARYMGGLQQEQGQCITRKQAAGGL